MSWKVSGDADGWYEGELAKRNLPRNMNDWSNRDLSVYGEIEAEYALRNEHYFLSSIDLAESARVHMVISIRYFIKHIIEKHC